jgi:hypothetical protein
MKRRLAVYAVVLSVLLLALTGGWVPTRVKAETGTSSLDVIVIDNEGYKSDRKGPVTFTHKKHALDYRVSCWECHHEFKDGKNVWAPWENTTQCSECHDPQKDQGKAWNLQKAFHVNCKNCHQGLAAQKKKTGPYKKCFGCHKDVEKK